ncbi:MAG: hypothetical protein BWK77_03280 [Verrucomicrobia bacterium A1]|nr:MAG: hypothetical protein BWK77_03280 [Verrucomicrobia bacterium A1]
MNAVAANRTLWGSASVHGAILVAVLSASLIRGCIVNHTPREIVTFIAMQEAAPTIADLQMPPLPEPAKPEPEPAKPEPVPEPPKDIPEPTKTPPKPVKPKIEISKVKIKRPAPPKPVKPLTAEELRRILASGKPIGPVGPSGPVGDFPFDWYLALIRKAMYDAWEQPGGLAASAGLKVVVEIRIARDGAILKRDVLRTSGHPLMDESVSKALQGVRQVPPLPDAYRGATRDLQIAFELTDGAI